MNNKILEKFSKGEKMAGAFSILDSSAVIESLGLAGLDFVIIDTEHGPSDVESTVKLILAAERRDIVPIVRVKDASRSSILKMLDIGAMGLMVPFIKSVAEVQQVIEYAKYVPMGQRGFGASRINAFGMMPGYKSTEEYFETCNRETLIIPQCETVEALECIEEICDLEGVAGIFLGPYDLSIALGKPAQFQDPTFISAIERVTKACRDSGKFCLGLAMAMEAIEPTFAQGFDAVVHVDMSFLMSSAIAYAKAVKS